MGVGGGDAIGRVEADPAQVLDKGLRPGVAGLLRRYAVDAVEVAPHIARRDAEASRRRHENMGEVLADAAPQRERFRGGSGGVGGIGVEGDFAIEPFEKRMQQRQIVAARIGAALLSRTG